MLLLRPCMAAPLLLIVGCRPAAAPATRDSSVLIDGAAIFSADEEKALGEELQKLSQLTPHGATIVTLSSLDGVSPSAYAARVMRDMRKSVVIIVAPNERKLTIWVNRPLLPLITEAEVGAIISNEITPHFRRRAMYLGMAAGLHALRRELDEAAVHRAP